MLHLLSNLILKLMSNFFQVIMWSAWTFNVELDWLNFILTVYLYKNFPKSPQIIFQKNPKMWLHWSKISAKCEPLITTKKKQKKTVKTTNYKTRFLQKTYLQKKIKQWSTALFYFLKKQHNWQLNHNKAHKLSNQKFFQK